MESVAVEHTLEPHIERGARPSEPKFERIREGDQSAQKRF